MPYEINDNRVDGGVLVETCSFKCECGTLVENADVRDFFSNRQCSDCKERAAYFRRKADSDRRVRTHAFRLKHEPGYQAGER